MANVNLVVLMGNLGKDPELRVTQRGTPVATFSLATSEGYTDPSGGRGERTDWHRVVVWGTAAEACKEYLHKGRLVHVEGSLRTRSYADSTGHTRGVVEVVARRVQFLGVHSQERDTTAPLRPAITDAREPGDDDIPF
jgi:single-strand DNA-binding protein